MPETSPVRAMRSRRYAEAGWAFSRVTEGSRRYVSSSIGRAAVSKTAGWGFESLLTCTGSRKAVNRQERMGW